MAERYRVSCTSRKVDLHGYLYTPGDLDSSPLPRVVLSHGFSGTMDRLTTHATPFAEAAMAALVFDHRTFGENGGEPRQLVDIDAQQADIRAAGAFARSRPDVAPKPIALWGNSLGGGTSSPSPPQILGSQRSSPRSLTTPFRS